jgi:hypothetical protein
VNQVRARLAALSLLDRALRAFDDDELTAAIAALDDDHRTAVLQLAEVPTDSTEAATVAYVRTAAQRGRINGVLEQLALVITDVCLAECIRELGDASDNPSEEQLRQVLPELVERHTLAVVRLMMASAIAGEAQATPILTRLLKSDDTFALPAVEATTAPVVTRPAADDPERERIKAERKERKRQQQAEAQARREQAAQARRRG